MEKEGEIRFVDLNLKESFEKLENSDKEFYEEIQNALNNISNNVFCGRNVQKELIPKEYIQKYNITNLWKYNLPNAWRLLYSITTPTKVEIISVILDWMDHKDYERLFKF